MRRLAWIVAMVGLTALLCVSVAYARYRDWPAFDDSAQIRNYLPAEYPLDEARHYTLRSFMDTWELYRFTTSPEAVAFIVEDLYLESQGLVYEFPLIISKPPPYWWDPELLVEAELYSSFTRARDGRMYDLLYSEEESIVYMIRFDG